MTLELPSSKIVLSNKFKSTDSGAQLPGFESQLYHSPAVRSQEHYLTSLCLSSFCCKVEITAELL